MRLDRYFNALSLAFVIGGGAFYSGVAHSQAPISFDPPTVAKVQKAIDALPDSPSKQALADASNEVDPVFIILPGILGSNLSVTVNGQKNHLGKYNSLKFISAAGRVY
jgi:hypothetical protein